MHHVHIPNTIRQKVMIVLTHKGNTLVSKGYDSKKQEHYHRLLGGTLEFGELAEDGIRREVREELRSELADLYFIQILENIFTFEGEKNHEIIFLFQGTLLNPTLFEHDTVLIQEPTYQFEAFWMPIEEFTSGRSILYPTVNYLAIFESLRQ